MRIKLFTVAAAFAAFCLPASAAKYIPDGPPSDPSAPVALNCGNIHGRIGGLPTWISDTSNNEQISRGVYGGEWGHDTNNKSQYTMVPAQSNSHTDTIIQKFKRASGTKPRYLTVNVSSEAIRSGRSNRMNANSPTWWWTCHCVATHDRPLVRYRIQGRTEWITPGMDNDSDASDDNGTATAGEHDSTDAAPPPAPAGTTYPIPANVPHHDPNKDPLLQIPTPNYPEPTNYPEGEAGTDGDYEGTTSEKLPNNVGTLEVRMVLNVSATVSCDNATVTHWKVGLDVDFRSETVDKKP